MSENDRKDALIHSILRQVPFDGWSEAAIVNGAAAIDMGRHEAEALVPGGPAEVMRAFSAEADRRMLEALEKADLDSLKVRERIALAVKTRLSQNEEHKEALRRALAYLSLPQNAALATKLLYRTVDAMWRAAGDTSTDYNFYTKRLLLAGVYSSTLLVWLDDTSEDHAETWSFLDRRIEEVLKIGGKLGKGMKGLMDFPDRLFRVRAARMGRRRAG